jgi:cysteine synthase A
MLRHFFGKLMQILAKVEIFLYLCTKFITAMIVQNLTELIGKTPMLEIALPQSGARVLLKMERFNPGGSVKDRTALAMIEDAEQRGLLRAGGTIIEPTSGNTGVGLAWIGRLKGYRVILTMPDTMSVERRNLLAVYGAELVLTPGAEGMKGAIRRAEQLRDETAGSIILGQFINPANPAIHYSTTGQEIWADTEGKVDVFIGGAGTGGTVSGVGRALKEKNAKVEIIAVEPATSPVLSGGQAGAHKIQGIGAGFVPETYQAEYVDHVLTVSNEDAYAGARTLAKEYGLLVGISSGAAFAAAYELAKQPDYQGKTIVALLPDTGERYLSVIN